jgi:hypothetical protein
VEFAFNYSGNETAAVCLNVMSFGELVRTHSCKKKSWPHL